jgi:hypothetical protein
MTERRTPESTEHRAEPVTRAPWAPPQLRRLQVEETAAGGAFMPDGMAMMNMMVMS